MKWEGTNKCKIQVLQNHNLSSSKQSFREGPMISVKNWLSFLQNFIMIHPHRTALNKVWGMKCRWENSRETIRLFSPSTASNSLYNRIQTIRVTATATAWETFGLFLPVYSRNGHSEQDLFTRVNAPKMHLKPNKNLVTLQEVVLDTFFSVAEISQPHWRTKTPPNTDSTSLWCHIDATLHRLCKVCHTWACHSTQCEQDKVLLCI